MKKSLALLLFCAIMLTLSSCSRGVVSFVKIPECSSEIYSEADIESARNIVISNFEENWSNCMLLEVSYVGDEWLESYRDWADRNDADEVIVILTDFYISYFDDNPAMNTGSKYKDYNWILIRNEGEEWQIADCGY